MMRKTLPPAVIAKFWASVQQTRFCWNWTGFLGKTGAPIIRDGARASFAEYSPRQVSLILTGKEPSNQSKPMCKNKLCVNPDHLVSGDVSRFWNKVIKLSEGCWAWTGGHDKDMYGKFTYKLDGKKIHVRAHRYSWELHNNHKISTPLLQVCHTCDHPWCVNPSHLFLGTCEENLLDRDMKGRCPLAKLNAAQVREIRELHQNGMTVAQLSNLNGVLHDAIRNVITRKSWAWA
jgi:hypothetical protein